MFVRSRASFRWDDFQSFADATHNEVFFNSFFSDFFDHPCLLIRLFVLFTSRAKYHKLKYGTELNQGDMKPPSYDSGKCPVAQTGNSTSYLILNHCDCGVHMPQGTGLVCMWRLHSCWILFASIAFFCVLFCMVKERHCYRCAEKNIEQLKESMNNKVDQIALK